MEPIKIIFIFMAAISVLALIFIPAFNAFMTNEEQISEEKTTEYLSIDSLEKKD